MNYGVEHMFVSYLEHEIKGKRRRTTMKEILYTFVFRFGRTNLQRIIRM